jgi:hypothetical protein
MFWWKVQESIETTAQPQEIWKLWSRVSEWPAWDDALDWCELDGPFSVGTKGKLKSSGWRVGQFILTEVKVNESFCNRGKMPLTWIDCHHRIEKTDGDKIKITHEVRVWGLLAPLLFFTIGRKIKRKLPDKLSRLAEMAEHRF